MSIEKISVTNLMEDSKELNVPASAPQVFSNISPARYAALVERANRSGINLTGNWGTASQFGVEVEWNYMPDAETLTIQCLSTPFFIGAHVVDARIKALVEETPG
jgi:hypothetical protein